jgi:glycosyltransferase involved in cell wall biosynthesis
MLNYEKSHADIPCGSLGGMGVIDCDGNNSIANHRETRVHEVCRVLVINDFTAKGGAEEVYRISAELLGAMPGVDVECFDCSRFDPGTGAVSRAWNHAAARALARTISTYRPHRVLVHNYHNLLSPSVLGVVARHKRTLGYTSYLTCHDYHVVYYNPTLLYYSHGRVETFPIDALRTRRALLTRASAKGPLHDTLKKLHWHTMRALWNPANVFDLMLCPSPYMQQALGRAGIENTALLLNPVSSELRLLPPKTVNVTQLNLAFVGRIAPEKGLEEFIQLARHLHFSSIARIAVYGEGPERALLEQRYADLISDGRLVFRGRLAHQALFAELRDTADALVLPSLCAENAPLAIVEAGMLGLPVLVHDIGSLSTFGDEIGNKIKYRSEATSYRSALDELMRHLADPRRHYDVSAYTAQHYARRLAEILNIDAHATSPMHAVSVPWHDRNTLPTT